jgi:hypothetical protein
MVASVHQRLCNTCASCERNTLLDALMLIAQDVFARLRDLSRRTDLRRLFGR